MYKVFHITRTVGHLDAAAFKTDGESALAPLAKWVKDPYSDTPEKAFFARMSPAALARWKKEPTEILMPKSKKANLRKDSDSDEDRAGPSKKAKNKGTLYNEKAPKGKAVKKRSKNGKYEEQDDNDDSEDLDN